MKNKHLVWDHIFPLKCMRIFFHRAWILKIYSKNIKCFCLACFICSCNFFFFYSSILFELCSHSLEYTEQPSATEPSGKKRMRNLSYSWGRKKEKAYLFFLAVLNLSTSWDTTCTIIKEFCDITTWNYENIWGESITKWRQLIPNFIIYYNFCLSEQLEINWFLWLVYSYVAIFLETCTLQNTLTSESACLK